MNTFVTSLRDGYTRIPVDLHCVETLYQAVEATLPEAWNDVSAAPVTETDVWQAIRQGAPRKSPGDDGIPVEFYKWGWTVMKEELVTMYNHVLRETMCRRNNVHSEKGDTDCGVGLSAYHPLEYRL